MYRSEKTKVCAQLAESIKPEKSGVATYRHLAVIVGGITVQM